MNLPVVSKSNQACNNISRKSIYWTISMEKILIPKHVGEWLIPASISLTRLHHKYIIGPNFLQSLNITW